MYSDSIHKLYQHLFNETAQQTYDRQKNSNHLNRDLLGRRWELCTEIDARARREKFRARIHLGEIDNSLDPFSEKLFIKYQLCFKTIQSLKEKMILLFEEVDSHFKYCRMIYSKKPANKEKNMAILISHLHIMHDLIWKFSEEAQESLLQLPNQVHQK